MLELEQDLKIFNKKSTCSCILFHILLYASPMHPIFFLYAGSLYKLKMI